MFHFLKHKFAKPKARIQNGKLNVIVTGGAGFIGSHLSAALLKDGYNVYVVDNLTTGKKENIPMGAQFMYGDIRHVHELNAIFKSVGPIECVFHLAASPEVQFSIENPFKTNDINGQGTFNVIHVSHVCGAKKLIYSSSASVYGNPVEIPTSENAVVRPLSPYAVHKHVGEHYCEMYSIVYKFPTVCLRYFNVYGPGQSARGAYASAISLFLKFRKEGKPLTITGDGEQTRDFVHVSDVVAANILAMKKKEIIHAEVINIASGVEKTINEIASLIGGEKVYVPARLEPRRSRANISRALKLLGWTPKVTLDEGIAQLRGN